MGRELTREFLGVAPWLTQASKNPNEMILRPALDAGDFGARFMTGDRDAVHQFNEKIMGLVTGPIKAVGAWVTGIEGDIKASRSVAAGEKFDKGLGWVTAQGVVILATDGVGEAFAEDRTVSFARSSEVLGAERIAAESAKVNAAKSVALLNEIVWPPNRGFLSESVPHTLDVGYRFDRYGRFFDKTTGEFKGLGTFVAKEGTPYPARALPAGSDAKPFSTYEVLKPMPDVLIGPSKPWFNQPGLGIQHELPMPIQDLVEQGYIRRID